MPYYAIGYYASPQPYYAAMPYYAIGGYYASPQPYYAIGSYYAAPVTSYYARPVYYAAPVTSYYAPYYGGGGCWAYGTLVTLADGTTKLIEEVVKGDVLKSPVIPTYPNGENSSSWYPANVWSLDNAEGITYETTTVVNLRHVIELAYYKLNGTMKLTGDHFLFVYKNGSWQFAKAEEISVGDLVKRSDGSEMTITSKDRVISQTMVVDIDVEENDLFLADGIITHNFKL
jgi:hypothetical protein